MINSKIAPKEVRVQIASIQPFDFVENVGGLMQDDQDDLITELNNPSSDISLLRDNTDADIVVVFTDGEYTDNQGIAGNKFSLAEDDALATVELFYANTQFLTAHEIGHLFGCRHQEDADPEGEFEHAHGFKTGWGLFGIGEKLRTTAMYTGYGNSRIGHYSNPRVNFKRESTGVDDEADNARMVNATGCLLSSYKMDDLDELSGFIIGPYAVCLNESVGVEASISGGTPTNYHFVWRYSYDGFNYTNLNINADNVSIPGLFKPPTDKGIYTIYIRLIVTDVITTSQLIINKTVLATNLPEGQENPCTHHGSHKRDNKDPKEIITSIDNIFAYPNPADDVLILEGVSSESANITYEVYDVRGRKINTTYTTKNNIMEVFIGDLSAGVYVINLQVDGEIFIFKFIKK